MFVTDFYCSPLPLSKFLNGIAKGKVDAHRRKPRKVSSKPGKVAKWKKGFKERCDALGDVTHRNFLSRGFVFSEVTLKNVFII